MICRLGFSEETGIDETALSEEASRTLITCEGHMDVDYENSIAVFHEDVYVDDPSFQMWSDEMTVFFKADLQSIAKVIAVGSVRMKKDDRSAKSDHCVYDTKDGSIVLTGNPLVKKGEDVLSGEKITFYRHNNKMLIEPRAKLIMYSDDGSMGDEGFF